MNNDDCFWADGDMPDKVLDDSMRAIRKNIDHMSDVEIKAALAHARAANRPDGRSQLCDRLASDNFQG